MTHDPEARTNIRALAKRLRAERPNPHDLVLAAQALELLAGDLTAANTANAAMKRALAVLQPVGGTISDVMWVRHLEHALTDEDSTVILMTADDAAMVMQVRGHTPAHFVQAAQALLRQAAVQMDDGNDGDDLEPVERQLLEVVRAALKCLPDRPEQTEGRQ